MNNKKFAKKLSNKKLRKQKNLLFNNNSYKKAFDLYWFLW